MIVSNIESNHAQRIKKLAENCDEIIIVSPFLFHDFEEILEKIITNRIKKIILITTLKDDLKELSNKSVSFISLVEYLEKMNINWTIHINNKLHGKVYIFKNNEKINSAIITSANFTFNGMVKNHEWGFELNDNDSLAKLNNQIFSNIQYKNIRIDQIIELMIEVDKFSKEIEKINRTENKNGEIARKILENTTKITIDKNLNYFIKPVGASEEKIWDGDFSQDEEMYFSRRRPNSVHINDYLFAYAVGPTSIISIFKVTSEPKHTGNKEHRWPWYVEVENITKKYGKVWNDIDLKINSCVEDYLRSKSDGLITSVGGTTLGALMFGADKIKLDIDFAEYFFNVIWNKEHSL